MQDANDTAARVWRRIETRLAATTPPLTSRLPGGASNMALDEAERRLGFPLPPLVRAMYASHDGVGMPACVNQISRASYMLSLADALDAWQLLADCLRAGNFDGLAVETSGPVRAVWWSDRWLPVTSDSAGNAHCVDVDPATGGTVGQVISFWHDDPNRTVEAGDLGEFLLAHLEEDEWAACVRAERRFS